MNDRNKFTYIGDIPIAQRVNMVKIATGTSGASLDYVRKIHSKLQSLGIVDTDVEEFFALLLSQTCVVTMAQRSGRKVIIFKRIVPMHSEGRLDQHDIQAECAGDSMLRTESNLPIPPSQCRLAFHTPIDDRVPPA